MKFNLPLLLGGAAVTQASVFSSSYDYDLVGFAKDNPIGQTTGGKGGATTTVSTIPALRTALADAEPRVVVVQGEFNLTGQSRIQIGSNKSLIGHKKGAKFSGAGFTVANKTNVIIRNLQVSYVLDNDLLTLSNSTRIWVDHNEFFSDINHGPDYYDGQVDIIRASDWITVSWNYFHDHWKVKTLSPQFT